MNPFLDFFSAYFSFFQHFSTHFSVDFLIFLLCEVIFLFGFVWSVPLTVKSNLQFIVFTVGRQSNTKQEFDIAVMT